MTKMAKNEKRIRQLEHALKRATDFIEGICIITGPAADAFTRQQVAEIARCRRVLKNK